MHFGSSLHLRAFQYFEKRVIPLSWAASDYFSGDRTSNIVLDNMGQVEPELEIFFVLNTVSRQLQNPLCVSDLQVHASSLLP